MSSASGVEHTPAHDHQANGGVEKAVRDLKDQIRVMLHALSGRVGQVSISHPLIEWMVIWAAELLAGALIGHDGMTLIADIKQSYGNYNGHLKTEILVASIRHPMHVVEAAKIGADVATVPPDVLRKLAHHVLTDKGLAAFLADWEKTGQTIAKG